MNYLFIIIAGSLIMYYLYKLSFDESFDNPIDPENAPRDDNTIYCKNNKGTLKDINLSQTLFGYQPLIIKY